MALAQILLRRGTSAEWSAANPVLAAGEFGYDTTAKRAKVGDGQNAWTALPWVTMSSAEVTRLEAAASALEGATAPTDAAMTTIQANPNSAFAQAQKATFVAVIGKSNGTDDSAMINAALAQAAGGRVVGLAGQTYRVNAPIVIPSGTTLDVTGCVLQQTSGAQRNMLRNAAVSAARTLNDVTTTAGSATITSATGAFAAADVGAAVRVYLGDNGRPRFLVTTVASVTNATTAVLAAAPDTSRTMTGATIGTRDRNVRVVGGKWQRYTSAFTEPSTNDYHTFFLRRVDGLTIAPETMGQGAGKYMVHLGDVTEFTVEPFRLDQAPSDGVHVGGWCFGGVIRGTFGHTGDDIFAITGADYVQYNDCSGDVSDITVEDVTYTTANAPGRFLVCSDASGQSLSHITIRRTTLRRVGTRSQRSTKGDPLGRILLSGVVDGVTIEDTDRYIVFDRDGGTNGTMRLDNLEVRRHRPRFDIWDQGMTLAGPTGRVLVDGLVVGAGTLASNNVYAIVLGGPSRTVTVESIEVRNFKADRADGVNVRLVSALYPNVNVKSVRIGNGYLRGVAASGRLVDVGGSCTLDALTLDTVTTEATNWDVSHGGSGTTRVLALNCRLGGNSAFRIANTASLEVSAPGSSLAGAPAVSGTGTVKPMSTDTRVATGGYSRVAGALAFNTDSSRSYGVGPVYCDGTNWINLATSATG